MQFNGLITDLNPPYPFPLPEGVIHLQGGTLLNSLPSSLLPGKYKSAQIIFAADP
jgi:hypothetical protein